MLVPGAPAPVAAPYHSRMAFQSWNRGAAQEPRLRVDRAPAAPTACSAKADGHA